MTLLNSETREDDRDAIKLSYVTDSVVALPYYMLNCGTVKDQNHVTRHNTWATLYRTGPARRLAGGWCTGRVAGSG